MKKKNKKSSIKFFIIASSIIILIVTLLMLSLTKNKLKGEVVVEVGSNMPDVQEFLIDKSNKGTFASDVKNIDMKKTGNYYIKIKVGKLKYKSLLIIKDTVAPVIKGVTDQLVYQGDTISYKKGITAIDNVDGEISVDVDNSRVSLDKVGVYDVIYIAKDKSGNVTRLSKKVNVVEKPNIPVDLQEVNKLADDVLAGIINESMSQVEKAKAIYGWVKGNIRYIDYSDKSSWVRGAYEGLTLRKGDCFVYFATSKILLSRVGIDNLDIKEVNGKHYWNMVNYGDGWYHFDTTNFKDSVDIFMWTDTQLDNLYVTGVRLHVWDKTSTPPTPQS